MILKGSQRGGPRQLAVHLLNALDNDHITVEELRGFVASDLHGAMAETEAVAKGTRCKQAVFSLSLNPPKGVDASIDDLREAADRAEKALGLEGQPRALVIHEKAGRRHAHVVWSRIDAEAMKAINLPHFKNRLNALARDLYLDHGWDLPDGLKTNGWKSPLNFTLAEWQQAKRLDLDPRELKQMFREAWERSDGMPAFRNALEESGYFLARGDRRGFVALDINGEVFSLSRWTGVKPKALEQRLGSPERLPGVAQAQGDIRQRMSRQLRGFIAEDRKAKQDELKPLAEERQRMVAAQRLERARLLKGQKERWAREAKARSERFRAGFNKVLDILTGKAFATRRQNEQEAWTALKRDRFQREDLFQAQFKDREGLHGRTAAIQARHREERMRLAARIAQVWRDTDPQHEAQTRQRQRSHDHGLEP